MTLGHTVQSIDENRLGFGRGERSVVLFGGIEGGLEGIIGSIKLFEDGAGMGEVGAGTFELGRGKDGVGTGKEVDV